MSKELEALNYLVNLAVVGNKENNRGKVFTSEEIVFQALKKQAKILDVLKKKCVSKGYIQWTENYKDYNELTDGTEYAELTQEEYDLLREWLNASN